MKRRAPSVIEPANGSSNATTRCSCASAWAPTSNTIRDPTRSGDDTMSIRREQLPPGDEPDRRYTMDTGRNDLLGEIASDAALERSDALVQATEQLVKFIDRHRSRIATLGGMTLTDD